VDPDPGGPKTCGSGGSGSATLVSSLKFVVLPITHVVLHIEGDDVDELCGTARGEGGKLVPTTHKPD
jgi:hypothetical protein